MRPICLEGLPSFRGMYFAGLWGCGWSFFLTAIWVGGELTLQGQIILNLGVIFLGGSLLMVRRYWARSTDSFRVEASAPCGDVGCTRRDSSRLSNGYRPQHSSGCISFFQYLRVYSRLSVKCCCLMRYLYGNSYSSYVLCREFWKS